MRSSIGNIGFSQRVLMLALVAGCHLHFACAAESELAAPAQARSSTDDAVAYGLRFAGAMPNDGDGIQTQSKVLEEVVQACLHRGETDRAFAVARTIKGWQRGTACADAAAAFARGGQTNDARHALLVAEGWRALIREQTRDTNMGWTAGRIRDHIAAARAALGETAESAERLQKPMLDVNARVVGQWIAADTQRTNADFLRTLSAVFTNGDSAVQQGLGLGVLSWADRQAGLSTQAVDEIVAVVQVSLKRQPVPYQLPVQVELVRFLRRHGRAGTADALISELEAGARTLPGYYRSAGLADAAVLWTQTDTNRAADLLRESETLARQCVLDVKPAAFSHVAERAADMGQTSTVQRIYLDAIAAALAQPDAVPRLRRLVETCASLGGTGVPLTSELRHRLNELSAREEAANPPHVLPQTR